MKPITAKVIGILLAIALFASCTPGYAFNHSLRGEELPKHYNFYKQPKKEKHTEAVSVSEPENMIALFATGLCLIRILRKKSN